MSAPDDVARHYVCTVNEYTFVIEADDETAALLKHIRRATPDDFVHAFRTLWGMPADTTQQPACGAEVTPAYDFPGWSRPSCHECDALVALENAQ